MGDQTKKDDSGLSFQGVLKWIFESDPLRKERVEELRERHKQSLVKGSTQETARDLLRDAYLAGSFLLSRDAAGSLSLLDKHNANRNADEFEQWWRGAVTQKSGLGQFEFRMGAGWKLPEGAKYNGQIDKDKEGKSIAALDAVFLRNKDGSVEVLDHKDSRYYSLAVPYLIGQLAVPVAAGKAMAAIKLASSSVIAERVAKGSDIAGRTVSVANTGGGIGFAGSMVTDGLILKPEAIKQIAHLMGDPKKLSPAVLRGELNTIFEQYSYLNGPMSEQYFIPPIKANEDPLQRLQDLSKGIVRGAYESDNPFDRLTDLTEKSKKYRSSIPLTDVRNSVKENVDFQKGFLDLSHRALTGGNLSDQDMLALRFGMNVNSGLSSSILPQNGQTFSAQERAKTKQDLQELLTADYGLDDNASIAQIDKEVTTRLKAVSTIIRARDNSIQHIRTDNPFTFG